MSQQTPKDYLKALYQTRAENLCQIAQTFGQDKRLAKILTMAPANLHRLIRSRDLTFTEKTARTIEAKLNKPLGYLDIKMQRYAYPVYFITDLHNKENLEPSSYYRYFSETPSAYFVDINQSDYAPIIPANAKILVAPLAISPKNGDYYLLAYDSHSSSLPTVAIRRYDKQQWLHPSSLEIDRRQVVQHLGRCETAISALKFYDKN